MEREAGAGPTKCAPGTLRPGSLYVIGTAGACAKTLAVTPGAAGPDAAPGAVAPAVIAGLSNAAAGTAIRATIASAKRLFEIRLGVRIDSLGRPGRPRLGRPRAVPMISVVAVGRHFRRRQSVSWRARGVPRRTFM